MYSSNKSNPTSSRHSENQTHLIEPSKREFINIYVVFKLMESDLHQVIKAIDDLTGEHYKFFLLKRWSAFTQI